MAEHKDWNNQENRGSVGSTLYRLNELDDYKVADHSADIRGWEVKSRDGKTIGRVKDLVVDTVAEKVRYIDLELDNEYQANSDGTDMHLLVPVGAARLDEDDDDVYVDRITTTDEVRHYPRSTGRVITRDYERSVVDYYTGAYRNKPTTSTGTTTGAHGDQTTGNQDDPIIAYDKNEDENFYNQDCFNENFLYQNRRVR
ncbi:hypothetical protein GCM10023187_14250 [Nibrella viscosa]|uniref:PRC-barrel domain-containing protein n=1 Tax=Nibrella viscosa TaxID=1084524 RepID=A0ABP8K706_9BACT